MNRQVTVNPEKAKLRRVPITKETLVLKFMRSMAGLSLKSAGQKLSISGYAINHMETGKMKVPKHRIPEMVAAYGFTMDHFEQLVDTQGVPIDKRTECVRLVKNLEKSKLETVFVFLSNLSGESIFNTQNQS